MAGVVNIVVLNLIKNKKKKDNRVAGNETVTNEINPLDSEKIDNESNKNKK